MVNIRVELMVLLLMQNIDCCKGTNINAPSFEVIKTFNAGINYLDFDSIMLQIGVLPYKG